SGGVAGQVYAHAMPADTYIILGPNHTGYGPDFSIMHEGIWKTPLGDAKIDSDLAKEIYSQTSLIEADLLAHRNEHSIEVQLPFIQYLNPKFQFVPIAIRHYNPDQAFLRLCKIVAEALTKAIKTRKDKIMLVASTDFSHYEPQNVAEKNDKRAIEAILNLDSKTLFQVVGDYDISMCGFAPVAIVIETAKLLGSKKAILIDYKTSGDITGDKSQVVGYGGLIIE
ncbi:MAG: AmmeMemoRadiSam system protein B, partial [Candidatus Altiarchaeota archaeon]